MLEGNYFYQQRLNYREAQSRALWVLPSLLNFSSLPQWTWMGCWNPQLPLKQGIHLMQSHELPHCIPTGKHHHKVGLHTLPQSCTWLRSEINQLKQIDQLNTSCLPTEQLDLGGGNSWTWRSQQQSHWERGKQCIYHSLPFFPIAHKPSQFSETFNYLLPWSY